MAENPYYPDVCDDKRCPRKDWHRFGEKGCIDEQLTEEPPVGYEAWEDAGDPTDA